MVMDTKNYSDPDKIDAKIYLVENATNAPHYIASLSYWDYDSTEIDFYEETAMGHFVTVHIKDSSGQQDVKLDCDKMKKYKDAAKTVSGAESAA